MEVQILESRDDFGGIETRVAFGQAFIGASLQCPKLFNPER
jgi:hypothetical protein